MELDKILISDVWEMLDKLFGGVGLHACLLVRHGKTDVVGGAQGDVISKTRQQEQMKLTGLELIC